MKIKPTNDLLFKKMMTTTGKEYILEDFIEAVTGMKLTNVRPTNPYQIESYQKEIENLNPIMYSTIVDVAATTEDGMEIMIEMQLYQHKDFLNASLTTWQPLIRKTIKQKVQNRLFLLLLPILQYSQNFKKHE